MGRGRGGGGPGPNGAGAETCGRGPSNLRNGRIQRQRLAGVALDDFFDDRAVGDAVGPLGRGEGAAEGDEAFLRHPVEPPQLDERLGVVVDPHVQAGIGLRPLDHQGRRLLAPLVAAGGLAVGLALQSSLANFSSGIMLILFHPFKVGDFVEAGGTTGTVEQINVFNTVMKTGDNREIIVPNAQIFGGTITNFSARATRRIDLVIGIGYDDNIGKAKQIIEDILSADERILKEPAPVILVLELGASSVNLAVRPWVRKEDYSATRGDLLENIKTGLEDGGCSLPYPQQDVHLYRVGDLPGSR
ncbi:MAG: mechanosensitive ion channel [Proteobacteria bacterium]|nr:mechanosensitive ion channel [Pseudomonadota bacterium]